MAEQSRRVERQSRHDGARNLLFIAAAVEDLGASRVLQRRAVIVQALFPWGSLLRGVVGLDASVAQSLAGILAPDGRLVAFLSVTARDHVDGMAGLSARELARIADRHRLHGLELVAGRQATREEVLATRSTWGRRLLAGADRPVMRLELAPVDSAT